MLLLKVGDPYPDPMSPGMLDTRVWIDHEGNGLVMDFGLPKSHADCFKPISCQPVIKIFHEAPLPEGLLILGLESPSKDYEGFYGAAADPRTIWDHHPHKIAGFLASKAPRIKIGIVDTDDPEQKILAMAEFPMPAPMMRRLRKCWAAPKLEPSTYTDRLRGLLEIYSIEDLWERASRFV